MVRTGLLGRIAIAIDANFAGFRRESRSAGRTTAQIRRQINRLRRESRAASNDMRRFQGVLRNFTSIAAGAFAGFGIAEVTRGLLAFDRELTKINTLVGVSRETLQAWRSELVEISTATAILPQELSQGLFNIVSVGLEGEEALRALNVIARATATGLGDFGLVADAVSRLFGAFRADAVEASEAADVLFTTIRLGNDTADQFVQGFSRLSKQASNAGISINDLGGAMAFLTRSGFTARRASLGLGQVFAAIIRPAEQAKTALEEIGLTVGDFQELFTDGQLVEGLTLLNDLANARGVSLTQIFPDKEAINTALTFIREARDAQGVFGRFEREVEGAADRAFRLLEQSPEFAIRQSLSAINTQFQELAANVLPFLARNFDTLASVTTSLLFAFGVALPVLRGFGLVLRRTQLNRTIARLNRDLQAAGKQTTGAGAAATEFAERAAESSGRLTAFTSEQARVTSDLTGQMTLLGAGAVALADFFFGFGDTVGDFTRSSSERVETGDLSINRETRLLQGRLRGVNAAIVAAVDQLADAVDPAEVERIDRRIALLESSANDIRQALRSLRLSVSVGLDFVNTPAFAALGEQLAEEIQQAQTEATEAEVRRQTIEFEPVIPPAEVDRLLDSLRRRVQDASLSLSLTGATPFDTTVATQRLQFEREVGQQLEAVETRRVEANRRIAAEKEKGNAADFNLIAQQEDLLARLGAQEGQLRASLDVNTEIGAEVHEQFLTLGRIAQARQDATAATRRDADLQRELTDIARENARFNEAVYDARIRTARAGEDLVFRARQELELARVASQFRDADPADLQAELAIREAQFELDRRALELQRDFADAQAALVRAQQEGSEQGLADARRRIEVLEEERRGLEDLSESLRQYGDLQRQIADESRIDRFAQDVQGLFDTVSRGIEDAIVRWAVAFEDGKQLFRDLVRTIISEAIRILVVRQILGAIFGGPAGFTSSSLLGTSDFQGLQDGGLARRGFAIVGEAGPELVDFRRPGRVYSNDDLASAVSAGGGPSFTYAPVIQTSDATAVRREVARFYPEWLQGARQVVAGDMSDRSSRIRQSLR